MSQTAYVPARQPASRILRQAARLGLQLQPGTLPSGARILHAAIDETLDCLRQFVEPRRRSRQIVNPPGPKSAIRLSPNTGKDAAVLLPEVHAIPAGG